MLAGLPGAGKSFVIGALRAGQAGNLSGALGLQSSEDLPVLLARDLGGPGGETFDQALLHLDLFAQPPSSHAFLDRWIRSAERVSFVTIAVPVVELRARHRARLVRYLRSLASVETWTSGRMWRGLRRHLGLVLLFRRRRAMESIYRRWVAYAARRGGPHLLVDCSDAELRTSKLESPELLKRLF